MLKEGKREKLLNNNNICRLKGKLAGPFEFSHQIKHEKFYSNTIKVKRLSDNVDEIPIIVSEKMEEIDFSKDYTDTYFSLSGMVKTYRYTQNGKRHLKVYVFGIYCSFQEKEEKNDNFVFLEGYICKEPIFRKTLRGIEITDIIVAVNPPTGNADYIPCIAWNGTAVNAAEYKVGYYIRIKGRFQSRNYLKKYSDNPEDVEEKTAYEVSACYLKRLF